MIADKNPSLDIPRALLRIAECGFPLPKPLNSPIRNPNSAIVKIALVKSVKPRYEGVQPHLGGAT